MSDAKPLPLNVNGRACEAAVHPMTRLIDVLREDLTLTGTKEGCGEGECGACSVLVDGVVVNSCLIPVAQVVGTRVVTVEGLAEADTLHPVQEAFIAGGGAQCGICTPGMLVAAAALLAANDEPSEDEIRVGLAGNLCRCTGYGRIVQSVVDAGALVRATKAGTP